MSSISLLLMIWRRKESGYQHDINLVYMEYFGARRGTIQYPSDTSNIWMAPNDIAKSPSISRQTFFISFYSKYIYTGYNQSVKLFYLGANEACRPIAVAGATFLVPCDVVKFLQFIWRSVTLRWNLRVLDFKMKWLDLDIGHHDCNSSNGRQGDEPY